MASIDDHVTPARSAIYGYDAMGRMNMMVAEGSATTADYNYTTGTNQLASLTTPAGTRSIAYDGRGNPTSETRPGSQSVTTAYDGHGRLTGYARTGEADLAHSYNGMDDRVATTSTTTGGSSDTRAFVYAPDGRVLGEYGASASDVKAEFIWASPEVGDSGTFGGDDGLGGYMPQAVAVPDGVGGSQLAWVHANHMGVPAVFTGATGAQITMPTAYSAPGFPGQSRTLADLYYNRYRDYEPTTGRYIQADPIGLAGGANPYLYAVANPLRYMDPDGLQVRPSPRPPVARPRGPDGRFIPMNPIPRRPAPQYRPGELFAGPPGFRITPADLARARGQCLPGENVFTQYGRRAHYNYQDALGSGYQYNIALPSGRRPDAIDYNRRIVRELKPDNPRGRRRGERALDDYLRELEAATGQAWRAFLDLYGTPW